VTTSRERRALDSSRREEVRLAAVRDVGGLSSCRWVEELRGR
jgi:hypothetical protein